jgi:hypothetical protein
MNFLLNRGGAGKSLSRAETADEISKIMRSHIALISAYGSFAGLLDKPSEIDQVHQLQKEHRDDLAKLSEIVLSAGGVPPREASGSFGSDLDSLLRGVSEAERGLRDEIREQLKLKHHLRTVAVLEHDLANTERRVGLLQDLGRSLSIAVG